MHANKIEKVAIKWHLLYASIAMVVGFLLYVMLLPNLPVHEMRRVKIDVLSRDDLGFVTMKVTTTSLRRASCPTTITRYLTNMANSKVIVMTNLGNAVPPNARESEVPVTLRPPEPMDRGEWAYRAVAFNQCKDGTVVAASPSVTFMVD